MRETLRDVSSIDVAMSSVVMSRSQALALLRGGEHPRWSLVGDQVQYEGGFWAIRLMLVRGRDGGDVFGAEYHVDREHGGEVVFACDLEVGRDRRVIVFRPVVEVVETRAVWRLMG